MFSRINKSILLSILIFVLFPLTANAQIVINEFSSGTTSDWIELYDVSTESTDLSSYKLMDSGTNNKILSGTISPSGFISFSFSNWLNNGGDTVRLFKNDVLVDSIPYGGSDQVCTAGASESIGRYPDGNNTVERFSTQTRDFSNNSTTLNPCPTPTPEPTNTPTPTPTPTHTSTATPNPTAAPTKTPVSTSTKSPTPKPTIISSPSSTSEELVLGIQNSTYTPQASPEEEASSEKNFPIFPVILIVTGFLCIAGAVFFFIKNNVKKGN